MRAAARAWAARLLIVAALFAASASVMGYVSSGHSWGTNVVLYYVNPNSTQLTPAAVIAAVQEAATAWTVQTLANVQLTYAGTTSGTSLTLNYKNEVFFRNDSSGYAGETYWWYDYTNRLVDADIVFHEGSTRFYTIAGCTDGVYLEDLAIHEFGHALGLEHSPVSGATMQSTMPGYCDRTQLTLHSDDIAGVEAMYPSGSTSQTPTSPSSLSVSNNGTSSLILHWSDRSSNESGFYVERSTDGSSFSYVASAPANATSYNDGLLTPGTTYYYRVYAFNGAGHSTYSNVASSQTTASVSSAPSAPGGLQFSSAGTSVTLTWADGSTNESGFHIYVSENGSGFWQLTSVGAGVTSYTWGGLRAGTQYAFRVAAYNSAGTSNYSNTATGQVGSSGPATPSTPVSGAPAAPANLHFTSTLTSVVLSWTDGSTNENGFHIYVSENGSSFWQLTSVGAGVTTFTWSNLRTGTPYAFRVAAHNGSGTSGYSNIASGQVGSGASAAPTAPATDSPSAPSGLQFASAGTSITLTWADTSSNESGFHIYASESGSPFWQLASVGAGTTTYTWGGLRPGTPYAFRLVAHNGYGTSGYSNTASGNVGSGASAVPEAPSFGVPAAPANLQLNTTATSISLAWNDVSSNENGFHIYVSEGGSPFWHLSSVGKGATSFAWGGLHPGTAYAFRVTAHNDFGVSPYSNVVSGQTGGSAQSLTATPGSPAAPANLQLSSTNTSISLAWTDVSFNESGFHIYASEGGSSYWHLSSVDAGKTAFTWNGLRPGVSYAFWVQAYNAQGTSGSSNVASGATGQ